MNARPVALSILLVLVAVVIQTTLFGPGRIQPFGAAPMLVLSVVIACVRYLDSEPALLLGFTAGLLLDLLGGSPLGLWAMVYVVVTYVALRVRHRAEGAWRCSPRRCSWWRVPCSGSRSSPPRVS